MLYAFFNGKYLPSDKVLIRVNDLGLLRSYSVFDYLRTYNGKPFRLPDHLKRLRISARELLLKVPYSDKELTKVIGKLIKKSGREEVAIRLMLTGGYSLDSMSPSHPNFIILIEKLPAIPASLYEKGVKLISCQYQRPFPYMKHTNYTNAIRMRPRMKQKGAYEVLYCFNGEVLEVSRNNFFIVKGDKIITPRENVLQGITRKVIIRLARSKYKVEVRKLMFGEIKEADEAFLSGSSKKILPVVKIDDTSIGNGKTGVVTRDIMRMFDEFTGNY